MLNRMTDVEGMLMITLKEKSYHSSIVLCKNILDFIKKTSNIARSSFEFIEGQMIILDRETKKRSILLYI